MKSIFVLLGFVVLALAITREQKEQAIQKYSKECVDETGIDEEEVQKMRNGDYSNNSDVNEDYVFCMFRKEDIMTEDGVFKKDVAMSKLSDDEDRQAASDAIDACQDQRGSRPQENAFLMAKCYSEKNPGHGFL